MKIFRGRSALLLGCTIVALIGLAVVGVTPARAGTRPAVGLRALDRHRTVSTSATGTYDAFESNPVTPNAAVTANAMTISAGGTWSQSQSSAKDTGYWLLQGKSVALVVTSSTRGNTGCVFLGTLEATGINKLTKSKQGPYNCHGLSGTWYATKTTATKPRSVVRRNM
jgi:hypothetical protein